LFPYSPVRFHYDGSLRNPNWARDEVILALDLYFRVDPLTTSESHPEIVALSELLNKLPIHTDRPDIEKFRNPNGVYMKMCNILRLDPEYKGVGLTAGGKIEEIIWNEFAHDKARLRVVAEAIRAAAAIPSVEWVHAADEADLDEAAEGKVLTRLHKIRERNREIVQRKKENVLQQNGRLACEVCNFDFTARYGDLGKGFIECHHTLPLSLLKPRGTTKLTDLALVCANCHRMLHRGLRWLSVVELRASLRHPG
jgi:5-methylcytosine-specific restriction protein A